MLNTESLIPESAPHAAHIAAYVELTLLRPSTVPASIWRTIAQRIKASQTTCPIEMQAELGRALVACVANASTQVAVYGEREPAMSRNVNRALRNAYRPETVLQWVPTVTEVA